MCSNGEKLWLNTKNFSSLTPIIPILVKSIVEDKSIPIQTLLPSKSLRVISFAHLVHLSISI